MFDTSHKIIVVWTIITQLVPINTLLVPMMHICGDKVYDEGRENRG